MRTSCGHNAAIKCVFLLKMSHLSNLSQSASLLAYLSCHVVLLGFPFEVSACFIVFLPLQHRIATVSGSLPKLYPASPCLCTHSCRCTNDCATGAPPSAQWHINGLHSKEHHYQRHLLGFHFNQLRLWCQRHHCSSAYCGALHEQR